MMKGIMHISSQQAPSGPGYLLHHKHIPGMNHKPPDPDIKPEPTDPDMEQEPTDPDMEQEPTGPDIKQEPTDPDMKQESTNADIGEHPTVSAIFCDDCNTTHLGICPFQDHLIVVHDRPVPDDDPHRAFDSLSDSLEIRQSGVPQTGLGVWTREPQPEGVCFGPYRGDILTDMEQASRSGYAWEIRKGPNHSHYVDGKDETRSNWMRFVNCASVDEQQNLQAFQYKEQIYYRITRDIPADTELLVWYGENYWNVPVSQMIKREVKIDRETVALNTLKNNPYCLHDHDYHRTGEKLYKCAVCEKSFVRSSFLIRHMWTHTEDKPYKCAVCGKSFAWSGHLTRHVRKHTQEKPYNCSVCKTCFSQFNLLTIHMRRHTGERQYKCTLCEKSFAQSANLTYHMRNHTGEKPYKCSVCEKRFVRSGDLTCHMRTHTGEKPYKCSVCEKSFAHSGNLSCHMRNHTGDKPYKCSVCEKSFAHSGNLNCHMRTHP